MGIIYYVEPFEIIKFVQKELILFSIFWFLIGALDDFIVDVIWLVRTSYRRLTRYRLSPPMRARELPAPKKSGQLAIFIAAWQEAAVIAAMLKHTKDCWAESNIPYRIFVGCYPNDPATRAEIEKVMRYDPAIELVLCTTNGPTTKADCLNHLWRALIHAEAKQNFKAKAIILHDAEDMVHTDELRVFDYLIEKNAAVQLPVIPVSVQGSIWVSGHYCDEFAEAHDKTLVVREAVGASMPLAGVGCAIDRDILGRIATTRQGLPFDSSSMTEDYELGLHIGENNGKVILARLLDHEGNLVGTRACFPDYVEAAVRQKTRWMTGIALAGWDRLGWSGGVAEFWMRLRDRKALLSAITIFTAYLALLLTATILIGHAFGYISMPATSPIMITLLWINGLLLCWRLLFRAAFVWNRYTSLEALYSVPRTIIANMITIMAAWRAALYYWRFLCGQKLVWDKTEHTHLPVAGQPGSI